MTTYGYNEAGEQIQKATPSGTTKYRYDVRGRLAGVDTDNDGVDDITYAYNDDGIRVATTENGVVTQFVIDDQNPTGYAQVLEERDSAGSVQRSYAIGHDVISQWDSTNGQVYFVYDGHGSTRALLEINGQVVTPTSGPAAGVAQVFAYNAYGEALGFVESQAITTLLYSGEWYEVAVGMQYLRQRWYAPDTGRMIRRDPIRANDSDPQSLHKYLYVHADPIQGIDPTGQFFTAVGGLGSFTVSSAVRLAGRAGPALTVLDRVQTFADAVKIVGLLATTGSVPPGLVAGFLTSIIPFGSIFSKARIVGDKLVDAAEPLTDALTSLSRSGVDGTRLAQTVGEIGAISTARKLGFDAVTDFPTRHTGIDGLFRNGDKLVIVEAKGGTSRALTQTNAGQQMSRDWIRQKATELRELGYTRWADEIQDAADSGRIQGLVVRTPIENGNRVVDPNFTLKDWADIRKDRF